MTWQQDMESIQSWLHNAHHYGGGFIRTFTEAAMRADAENYVVLRPCLVKFVIKYPEYAIQNLQSKLPE